ncbi:ATP synthase F1 subunit gamma, partial [Paenarthrobacter sp. RAF9]
SYSATVLKQAEGLTELLHEEGKEVKTYVMGRKAQAYFDFRNRPYERVWTGNTDAPQFETAREVGEALLADFATAYEEGGVDEIHVVYTRFKSMVTQEPTVIRLLPLEVVEEQAASESELLPLYEFEPEAEQVLDALLPRYIESRIFAAMLQAAASELAARQRAMKSAGDNATDLIKKYTRLRNTARQAEITQELSEIVAGADALNAS